MGMRSCCGVRPMDVEGWTLNLVLPDHSRRFEIHGLHLNVIAVMLLGDITNVICGLCTPRWRRMALTLNITLHIKSIQVVKQVLTNSVSDQYRRSTQHYLHGRVNPPWHPPTSTDQQVKWTLWFRVHCDILWSKETKAAQMKRKHQVYPHSGGYHHNTNQKEVQRKARQTYRKKSHRAGATDGSTTPYTSRPGNWKPFWRILSFQRRD